jgi:hypothetical protein
MLVWLNAKSQRANGASRYARPKIAKALTLGVREDGPHLGLVLLDEIQDVMTLLVSTEGSSRLPIAQMPPSWEAMILLQEKTSLSD